MKSAMNSSGDLVPRHATEQVHRSLAEARVVVVNGPRQAGKTTLVRDQLHPDLGGTFVTLDDDIELAACLAPIGARARRARDQRYPAPRRVASGPSAPRWGDRAADQGLRAGP